MKAFFLYSSLLIFFVSSSVANPLPDEKTEVELAITDAMLAFNVPGIAVAVVQNDQVVFNQGFGFAKYGTSEKVTSETLFGIASNTKAMTVVILAQLVDQYKISWQTKIIDILPEFQLYNSFVTEEFTLIDLLSHRSGLRAGAGDLMIWPDRSYNEKEIIEGLQHLPQISGFRTEFAYNNLLYIIAGKVIEKITQKSWQLNLQERIFTPLKMQNSFASIDEKSLKAPQYKPNLAVPHLLMNEQLTPLKTDYLANFSSAASVISNSHDMAIWLKVLLNRGKLNTAKKTPLKITGFNQLYSETQASMMWQPHTIRQVSESESKTDHTHFSAYGLGWFVKDYLGMKLVHHSGGIPGMISKVLLIPDKNIGVVILTNQGSEAAINAIYREIFEIYLDTPEKNWITVYQAQKKQQLTRETNRLSTIYKAIKTANEPPLSLKKYAQTYTDKWYGDVVIRLNDQTLTMTFSNTPKLKGTLLYYQDNTFVVRWDDRSLNADAYVKFSVTPQGNIEEVSLKAISYLTDFSFDFEDLTLVPKS